MSESSRLLKLDAAFARSGVTEALQKMAVKDTPAKLVGRMFFWLVAFIFFVLALSVMRVPVIDQLLERFLLYLPNIFVALVVLAIGWFLGNFLGRAALIASVNAGFKAAGPLSKGIKGVILLFAFVMAFEQLGIGRSTVIAAFAIVFGGAVLALALAFGLRREGPGQDIPGETVQEERERRQRRSETPLSRALSCIPALSASTAIRSLSRKSGIADVTRFQLGISGE